MLEYYFWFRSRLHYQARAGFIPLGGTRYSCGAPGSMRPAAGTRTAWRKTAISAPASARRARTVVAYTPALATREETPETIAALVKQRTRWNQGFLQVLRKGDWRVLPLRARLLAAYTLAFPFLQAASALVFPFTLLLMYALGFPIELAVVSFLPLVPLFVILAVELAGLHTLERVRLRRARTRLPSTPAGRRPYQLLLCFAALRAVWRELQGPRLGEDGARGRTSEMKTRLPFAPAPPGPRRCDRARQRSAKPIAGDGEDRSDSRNGTARDGRGRGLHARRADAQAADERRRARSRRLAARRRGHGASEGRSRLAAWVSARRADLVVLAAVVTPVAIAHAWGMTRYPAFFDDEGTYVSQAYAVDKLHTLAPTPTGTTIHRSVAAAGRLGESSSRSSRRRRSRSPPRACSSCSCSLSAPRSSTGSHDGSARRSLSAFATLLFGLSPLAIHYQRMVLLDNIAVPWLLAAFSSRCPRGAAWRYAGSAICLAAAGLTKETFLLFARRSRSRSGRPARRAHAGSRSPSSPRCSFAPPLSTRCLPRSAASSCTALITRA